MKAIQINAYGGDDVVVLNATAPKPQISDKQLLIKMHAAGANPVDWKIRSGFLQAMRPVQFPFTLGMDFSGIVVAAGKAVTHFKSGDSVYGMSNVFSGGTGTFAEFICADAAVTSLKPNSIDYRAAAAFPMVGVSVWQALVEYMGLSKGQKILIQGGTGGIGSLAIQLAKHLGAYVATTTSTSNKDFAKQLGANEVIDYKNQSFENLLKNYDAVFDLVGGESYLNSFKILKKNGMIVSMLEQPNLELMQQYQVKSILEFTEVSTDRLIKLTELIEKKIIKIHIEKVFPFEEAQKALSYLQHNHPKGKIVVTSP